jgi:hypothetical protein
MTDNASAGATPAAGGATPPQTPAQPAPATPAAATTSATGDDDGLGDAGKRALRAERDRASAAERERDDLKRRFEELENSSKSEHEKALAQAKRDGATEVAERYQAAIRRSEVRAALTAAGVPATLIDLASRADGFAALKVSDQGEVQGLDEALEAFRKATPDLFAKAPATPPRPADFGGGPRGTPATGGRDMNTLIRSAAGRS